ncbi:MAG: class I SAM-dependent methyltransferase [Phenylobacterium sp.]|uniref:class I SAM-dependent methyltransferase n=1 Tax=Phenylobacterium sp. TaxID=1871053 RepID=UPI001A632D0A|nr:class I SAM-dependent methyltransferase [Phenylobacterium sp.]MBL8553908.1 class I SAM-dependent methyltransferase [Phenylobacterium sp.]
MAGGVSNEQRLLIGYDRLRSHLLNLAELIFLSVLETEPENPTALRLLGVTRCKLGRSGEGAALLRAAAERAPGVEAIWSDLAAALRDHGDPAAAAEAYDRAVALRDPAASPPFPLDALAFAHERATHAFEAFDYPYAATIRYGAGRPAHPGLAAIVGAGRERYAMLLRELGGLQADLAAIPLGGTVEGLGPFWLNAWFSNLDAMALIAMLRRLNPARMVEIGSGMSTKFARHAIRTYGLRTRVTSIDPQPRADIDKLCDAVIRRPLERCAPELFDALEPGDLLFLDSSHRSFQNSDVTVFFLEILPRLKPGVVVHVHDIYLPDDYIAGHVHRMWNEQYLLATALLFGADRFEILFPSWFVGQDPDLRALARAEICKGPLAGLDPYGASFWLTKTG